MRRFPAGPALADPMLIEHARATLDTSLRVDVHQHVWTRPLIEALAARDRLPLIDSKNGSAVLHCAGERPYAIDVESQRCHQRARVLRDDGLDLAVIALSSPIGIEALPRESATELIDIHLAGVHSLGDGFASWGPVALDRPEPADVDRLLARGCVGISLPAGALAGADALEAIGPVLERVASRGAPLFVHPGPARAPGSGEAPATEPAWWPAMTGYVAQMQSAWLAFTAIGRAAHPELVIVFSMLAGGAPLLSERLDTRGGPRIDLDDPGLFYDTSSYGPVAVEGMARRVRAEQLVYGSDRPVLEPLRTGREAALQANGARLLSRTRAAT
jgi:6-methylsalicylate decarboxylase